MGTEQQNSHRHAPSERSPRGDDSGDGAEAETTVLDTGDDELGSSRSSIHFEGPTLDLDADEDFVNLVDVDTLQELGNDHSRYKTFVPIGAGGVGTVASCFDPNLGRYVALKKLHTKLLSQSAERTRFIREARVMAQIEHPHIVPVHEMGTTKKGAPYFTMKKVRGNTLADILMELRNGNREMEKRYPLRELIDMFVHVAQAVAFAHSRGIIHRDLKPSNILIGEFGEVLVVDWGLAKVVGGGGDDDDDSSEPNPTEPNPTEPASDDTGALDELGAENVTIEGVVSGTPAYMAPEQALGKVSELTGQTDVYSLGAVLYELLTWQRMIHGDTVHEAIHNVVHGTIIPPRRRAPERKIAKDLEAICMKAVARHPEDRYASVKHMLADLANHQNDYPVSARRDSPVACLWKWGRRHRLASTVAIATLAVLALTAGALILSNVSKYMALVDEADGHRHRGVEIYQAMRRIHVELTQETMRNVHQVPSERESAMTRRLKNLEYEAENEFRIASVLYSRAAAQRETNRIRASLYEIASRQIEYSLLKQDFAAARNQLDAMRRILGPNFEKIGPDKQERLLVFDEISRGMGVLRVVVDLDDASARVSLTEMATDVDGMLFPINPIALPKHGEVEMSMPRGSYLIVVEKKSSHYFFPLLLQASRRQTLHVTVPQDIPFGMVYVPGGTFVGGGDHSRSHRRHTAEVPSFFIKETEVTFAEYIEFWLDDDGGKRHDSLRGKVRFDIDVMAFVDAWDDEGKLIAEFSPEMPVVGISQRAAAAYCEWLAGVLHRPVRLPTDVEWEKAARGVDGREFPWGDVFIPEMAMTNENRAAKKQFPYFAPVGSFPGDRSIYGAYDMAGNAREWTASTFEDGSPFFQIKGGSASLTRRFAACAYSSDTPVVPTDVGFRYAVSDENHVPIPPDDHELAD